MNTLTIPDQAGIQNATVLRELLLGALEDQAAVTLDLSAVVTTDLSFLQLVEAGRREAASRGKTLALAAPASGAVRAVLDRAGFAAMPAGDALDFWFHGDLSQ